MNAIKHTLFVFSCWLLVINSILAQNLVPNPSFENYTTCPTAASQLYVAPPWTSPTTGGAEYFNICSSSNVGVPFSLKQEMLWQVFMLPIMVQTIENTYSAL
jgi:hypothetical protein